MTLFGVNVPYFEGDYGHDLAPNGRFPDWPVRFDPMRAYRPLLEARDLGLDAVRVWLCENGEGVVLEDGLVAGVHPKLLDAVSALQDGAALAGVKLYWSLLDANAWPRERDPVTRAVLADPDATARFAERVATPLARRFDPRVTMAVELLNEPETVTPECVTDPAVEALSWETVGRALRTLGDAVRAARPAVLVTAGTQHVFLPRLWTSGAALDAVDVHVYHANGGIPSRDDLADYVGDDALRDPALPLILGEGGIPRESGAEEPHALRNYFYNAHRLGYAAAFLWQLHGDLVDHRADGRPMTDLACAVRDAVAALRAG